MKHFSANFYEIHDEDDDQSLPDIPLSKSSVDIVEKAAQLAEIPLELNLTTQDFHYNDSAVSFDIPVHFVQEQFEDTSSINTASTETLQLAHDLQWNNSGTAKEETKTYVTMHVHINRILHTGEREMAEDTGGLLRDNYISLMKFLKTFTNALFQPIKMSLNYFMFLTRWIRCNQRYLNRSKGT